MRERERERKRERERETHAEAEKRVLTQGNAKECGGRDVNLGKC
jgi:hypothetical protein